MQVLPIDLRLFLFIVFLLKLSLFDPNELHRILVHDFDDLIRDWIGAYFFRLYPIQIALSSKLF